ncbi:MAG: hypothetical protein EOS20_21365 [Mesorhizobium sp.]|uniref:hypothetical protein n=1 Tax=unclassified Mesorhizobium TaxID=325217 RepID=UPI000F75371A|nr:MULTISPECIES: hypothetical protein [unclassified Mesorhizobium]AZO67389.1 hypothetical protein EJ075_22385 [Mesorhizobium sp. M6A.T.Cr.TU.016.01.1.1]RWN24171.1 MAG: hypothetical protein EOR95_34290 [Mesorhizobium sp.]RWP46700.1 MAG: hypothetical protein EOR05_20395 [Mesorhizobium sp.]RWQ34608.1 MAG: hypothetical protein EOS20_21365 [Mesorhizobium sp.]
MSIRSRMHTLLRASPLRYYYHLIKGQIGGAPQSDESVILSRIAGQCPRTFLEFGFHPTEYNCIGLRDFQGLLVDGDAQTVRLARSLLPKHIEARQSLITLDNIHSLGVHFPQLGVLSVDVDGNDYWFLKALLPVRPSVIVAEYNASFGLNPITVPYDPSFDRNQKHDSGWYHGASITALTKLCKDQGYKLVAVSAAGGNVFFLPQSSDLPELEPAQAYRESALRNRWSGTTAKDQWQCIKHMPFVDAS